MEKTTDTTGCTASGTVMRLIGARHSIREFEDKPILRTTRELILGAGLRAPTAGNMMLYSILEIEDPDLKQTLSRTCDNQPFIAKSPWVLVFLADYARWMGYFRHSGVQRVCETAGTPMVGPGLADLLLAASDALVCAQTIVLAAESFGLGSCYIGDIMENYATHRDLLRLPDHVFPVAMLCLGYPSERQALLPPRPRFSSRHIVFTDRYRAAEAADYEDMFADRKLSADAMLPGASNFGQHMYIRKFSSPFMDEMRRSVSEGLASWDNSGGASGR